MIQIYTTPINDLADEIQKKLNEKFGKEGTLTTFKGRHTRIFRYDNRLQKQR